MMKVLNRYRKHSMHTNNTAYNVFLEYHTRCLAVTTLFWANLKQFCFNVFQVLVSKQSFTMAYCINLLQGKNF